MSYQISPISYSGQRMCMDQSVTKNHEVLRWVILNFWELDALRYATTDYYLK